MISQKIPQLVAHRGYMQCYPENSWPGLQAAIHAGACWLEFDIQMTAQGRFVLLHDGDFERTAGCAQSVFKLEKGQLQHISVHEPQRLGNRFAPVQTPALDTILEKISAFPGTRAMVEIKQESLRHWGLKTVMDSLLKQLNPFHKQCVLISYSHEALSYARRHSALEIGWVLRAYDAVHLELAQRLAPEFMICNEQKISGPEHPWPGPWRWMLYDITDPELALQWAERGIALIETRDIGAMLQHPVLAKEACPHGL